MICAWITPEVSDGLWSDVDMQSPAALLAASEATIAIRDSPDVSRLVYAHTERPEQSLGAVVHHGTRLLQRDRHPLSLDSMDPLAPWQRAERLLSICWALQDRGWEPAPDVAMHVIWPHCRDPEMLLPANLRRGTSVHWHLW
jgi:hypothetical protein